MSDGVNWIFSQRVMRKYDISWRSLRQWRKKGLIEFKNTKTGRFMYNECSLPCYHDPQKETKKTTNICYCRVSSTKQKDDLERQTKAMQKRYPDHRIITDIASGLNFKRKGLRTLLELAMQGIVKQVVVAHRDQLCRFGFELLQWILEKQGVQLVVLEDAGRTVPTNEKLVQDIMAILHVFNCRINGQRRYTQTKATKDHKTGQKRKQSASDLDISPVSKRARISNSSSVGRNSSVGVQSGIEQSQQ